MTMEFSNRVDRVEPSATLAIGNRANELEAQGVDIVDLSVGEPDFPTPENIVAAAKQALDAGHTGYTSSNGIPKLRSAVAEKLQADGLPYESQNVVITPGAKQALYEVVQALVDSGDEVILIDPSWVSYEAQGKLAGGSIEHVPTAAYEFQLEPALDDLAEVLSDETAVLLLNSPNNPAGSVYSDTALQGVRDLAIENDVTVVSDEIYKEITYNGPATSIAGLDGMFERTVTVNGFSKAYSMTGWRLGYFAAPESLVSQAGKLHSHSVTCATNFVQQAAVEAMENTEVAKGQMVEAFEERRDLLIDLLADHGVEVPAPEGAFYLMLPVAEDDATWAEQALEEAHVATIPGSAFDAPGYARISYASSTERIREGVRRLAENDYLTN
ncbi:MAG: aspartate aminotransferase [Natrialbaceae archaeon]|jgi:aspartate aminotransferase